VKVRIIGIGCARCNDLEQRARDALAELGIAAEVDHVKDLKIFASMGVFMTPGLVVDGKVVVQGRVPSKDEMKKLLGGAK
jgi:small redox-active disulfide protein 2